MDTSYIYEIDVAHPPRHPDLVEQALLDAWMIVRNSTNLRVLKIIHGYGSHGEGGQTRETVRNWAYQYRQRFEEIINGEEFSQTELATREMIAECGYCNDDDLGRANSGITLIWIN